MPKAYKCYMCRELYEGTPYYILDTTLVEGEVELCRVCTHKLKAFLRGPKATDLTDFEVEQEESS